MAAKYRAYAEYKDSGVEWLGAIPAHWEVKRLKHISPKIGVGLVINPSTYTKEEGNYFIFGSEVKEFGFDLSHSRRITQKDSDQLFQSRLSHLDLVSVRVGNPGLTAVVTKELEGANCASIMIIRKGNFNSYWLCAAMNSSVGRRQVEACAYGAAQKQFNISDAIDFIFPTPCNSEAEQIANFLDHETAKIDVLIEKQQQLIALLKEKRQAVISHAVTKGLNPKVKMKDSGVEWLGDVPGHWEVKRIGWLFSESSKRAETLEELELPVLSVSIHHGISDKELDEEEADRKITRSEDKSLYKTIKENDLAYNMMRAWQGGFGSSKIAGLVSPAYVVCNPKTKLNSYYFELVLRTANAVTELKKYSRGITDFRLRLYWDEFKSILVPVPSSEEVNGILKGIAEINDKYDHLILVAQQQIELLQERRTALISAAVTGKIDVRDWQA